MNYINKNQSGFSAHLIIIVILAIGVVGALGYVAYDRYIDSSDEVIAEQSEIAEDIDVITASIPEEIVDTSDLDEAISSLDDITDEETTSDINLITEQMAEF